MYIEQCSVYNIYNRKLIKVYPEKDLLENYANKLINVHKVGTILRMAVAGKICNLRNLKHLPSFDTDISRFVKHSEFSFKTYWY